MHKKIQQLPFATYPAPPPLPPDNYSRLLLHWEEEMDKQVVQPKSTPEWQNDADLYGFCCPDDKKFSCKRSPTFAKDNGFICNFSHNQKDFASWAALEIQADLKTEYKILTCACFDADACQKAKSNQSCFLTRDQCFQAKLEKLLQSWYSYIQGKKDRKKCPCKLKYLSQKYHEYYHNQQAHYQVIANAYENRHCFLF